MVLELIRGVAILLALSLLYGFNVRYWRNHRLAEQLVSGGLFGGICIIGMMLPIELMPGVIFDARSVILSMAALFGGPLVAVVSALIAGGYRLWLGGGGMYVGVAVVVACSALGLAYRYGFQKGWLKVDLAHLLVFGLIIHSVEILLFTQLPVEVAQRVIDTIGLPLILTFAPATVFLGLLLKDVENAIKTESALVESESLLSSHLHNTPLAAITWDVDFRVIQWNKAAQHIFGYSAEEAIGKHAAELIISDTSTDELSGVFKSLLDQQGGWQNENTNVTKDGRTITCEWYNTPVMNADGVVVRVASLCDDITRQKQADDEIKLMNTLLLTQQEASVDGIFATDTNARVISMNRRFIELWQLPADISACKSGQVILGSIFDRLEDSAKFEDKVSYLDFHREASSSDELVLRQGQIYESYSAPMFGGENEYFGRVWWFRDITERKLSEELIWKQANFDSLTGLANRQMLHDRLETEIRKAHRTDQKIALLYLDLDRFKEVNDGLGHDKGDELLIETAKRLSTDLRGGDTVARLGGDEFTIIMSELDNSASVERVANDILKKLAEPFKLDLEYAYVTASIGITFYPEDATNADEMLKNADQAMYAAKSRGRNCFQYFTPSMQQQSIERMSTLNDLRAALPNSQFKLLYQPIVELATGSIVKAEALILWQHPTRGLVAAEEFVPLAEESRLIIEIGDWVFRKAAEQAQLWQTAYFAEFQIGVDASPVQFQNGGLCIDSWLRHLQKLGLSGRAIALEVTEGLLIETPGEVAKNLLRLRDAGIQVVLDDFGSGYSSMSYLKKFGVDYLKIDESFVNNLNDDNDDMVLCEAIIAMAHKLGLKVVAAGIETQLQMTLLGKAGCDYGQGSWFSHALPAGEFEKLLATG